MSEVTPDTPHLIRLYRFDPLPFPDGTPARNLATNPDRPNADFVHQGNFSKQSAQPDIPSICLDQDRFAAPSFKIDNKSFTVEIRLRKLGQGTERGNDQGTNGMIFAMGNGWDRGVRLTTDYPQRNLIFSIGRPGGEKSINLIGTAPVPDNVWLHIATTWDGSTMRIYVNGIIYAVTAYAGDYTPSPDDFRIGFSGSGVGSLKMNLSEVAVYDAALPASEIMHHALPAGKLNAAAAELYENVIRDLCKKNLPAANNQLSQLPASPHLDAGQQTAFRILQADLSGDPRHYAELAAQVSGDNYFRDYLAALCLPVDLDTPTLSAPAAIYQTLLDHYPLSPDEKLAVQKCLIEAGFLANRQSLSGDDVQILQTPARVAAGKSNHLDLSYRPRFIAEITSERQRLADLPDITADQRFSQWFGRDFHPAKTIHVDSLIAGRDAVRKLRPLPAGGIEVIVTGGTKAIAEPVEFTAQDSGSTEAPVVYRADTRHIITGGMTVTGFKPVADPTVLARLPAESRGKVWQADLTALGIKLAKIPPVAPRGNGKNGPDAAPQVDLFINDQAMQIARYPNNSFLTTGKILQGFGEPSPPEERKKPGIFSFDDDRVLRWQQAPDAWLFGYWCYLWAATSCKIDHIDPEHRLISLATDSPYGYREKMPYYAFNLLEEIDLPGEWYLDRKTGILYLYPPNDASGKPVDLTAAKVRLSLFPQPFLILRDSSYIAFSGFDFEEGTGTAARISGGGHIVFADCSIRRFGNWAMAVSGRNHVIADCDLQTLGGGGIDLAGGGIKDLTPGGNVVENCVISDFSRIDRAYTPAVLVNGVGNKITHNLIYDSPHHAIRVEGMDHLVEYNEIHSVVYESDDQAGLDAWGNPFMRGIVIRHNYWHHIGSGRDIAGQNGIRLDDMISSVLMYGNVFYQAACGGFGGIQIHGGKDNIADNNLFFDCRYAFSFSPWEPARWREMLVKPGEFGDRMKQQGYAPDSDLFKSKYPDYSRLNEDINRNFIVGNLALGSQSFTRHKNTDNYFSGNFSLPWLPDLLVKTSSPEKYSLPADSPLYRLTGLQPVPFDLIGPYRDSFRKTIPKSEVTKHFVLER
jgi:hypothetical protein